MAGRAEDADCAPHGAFEANYNEYIRVLAETWECMTARIMEAQKVYSNAGLAASNEPCGGTQEAGEKAFHAYADAVRGAWEESQEAFTGAYANFLGGHSDAWAKTDLAGMSPDSAALVAQSVSVAAGYAASTIGNWSLVEWAGVPPILLSSSR